MRHTLSPILRDLQSESVLFQAWKKTEAYIRSHNWYADTLELDWQALRLPEFILGIQTRIKTGKWRMKPLLMVPAPKSQRWETSEEGEWQPAGNDTPKIRPLAHVNLEDQVIYTAVMLCLADRVENQQSDPTASDKTLEERKRLLSYGHRLFCRVESSGKLRHAWAAKKLYRLYSTDYRRFLARPEDVAKEQRSKLEPNQHIAIVTADLSRFYDRVRPDLLRERILELKQNNEEQSFFDFVGQLFDWEWDASDSNRAGDYAVQAKPKIDGFDHIALPQGLVAAGFFANLALLRFDNALSGIMGKPITIAPGVTLLDACRYVDDMRLVLSVPSAAIVDDFQSKLTTWLNDRVRATASGLWVERDKTHIVIQGEQAQFIVPQSRAAERIQHEISGGFDMEQGMNIIGALEGFIHAQHQYSPDAAESPNDFNMVMKGISDMRDDTAIRFAAARYRRTFRSLRPLLDSGLLPKDDEADLSDEEEIEAALPTPDSIISREQFDERGLLFASSQIAAWESNPAHVRLMRIAVDLFPRAEFCTRILTRLRPAWTKPIPPRQREALLYCLSELFRAGATETGIVSDHDELPDNATGTDASAYHETLLTEGRAIIRAATLPGKKSDRFPWYLLQQVMLYLATRQESLEDVDLSKLPGADGVLRRYVELYRFYTESYQPNDAADKARFMIMQARSFDQQAEMISRAAKHPTAELLRSLATISPSFADRVWREMKPPKQRSLASVARVIGLTQAPTPPEKGLTNAAALSGLQKFIWQEEYNIVVLARDLMVARQKKRDAVLTPWRIFCEMKAVTQGPVHQRIVPKTMQIVNRAGGEMLFALPDWCETDDERIRVEVGQVLRYLITGSVEYFRAVPRNYAKKNLPQYSRALSSWELGRYGSFNGRAAFGPDWLPLSAWAESLLIGLLRWPGCGTQEETERTTAQWISHLNARIKALKKMRGEATGILYLDQEARLPRRPTTKWERKLRIAIVQTVVPDLEDFKAAGNGDLQLNGVAIRQRHRRHLRLMLQGVRKMLDARLSHLRDNTNPHLDWLILPELAVHPDDVVPLLLPVVRRHKCIVLAGLVYHPKDAGDPDSKLINSALWLIPEWSPEHGLQVSRIEQGKAQLAPGPEKQNAAITGYRPAQWIVRYHWSSNPLHRPLLLSAAVCYDATDTGLAHDLRNRNDFFAICALNKDIPTYDNLAATLNYHLFQGVLVVNNGQFGGSNFHVPLKESYERKLIHFHGQAQAAIGFSEIAPAKFVSRPAKGFKNFSPVGDWKQPPAGWTKMPTEH